MCHNAFNTQTRRDFEKTCKPALLKKIELSVKFPWKIVNAKKSALGIDFIVDTLVLKLCLDNKRKGDKVAQEL